jgi:hypothetical protein
MKIIRIPFISLLLGLAACQSLPGTGFDPEALYTSSDGRKYKLERLEKNPGGFAKLPGNKLRYFPFAIYDLEREDDSFLYVRQYVPVAVKPVVQFEGEAVTPFELPATTAPAWLGFDAGLPRSGQWRDGFAVADVNGDGKADLIFAPARKSFSIPTVFLGDGTGQWKRWAEARFASFGYDYGSAAVADFDGDGKPDIAFGVHLRGLFAVRGNGEGDFAALGSGLPTAAAGQLPAFSSRKIRAFDWAGDGKPALVALNEGLIQRRSDMIADSVVVYQLRQGQWSRAAHEPSMSRATTLASSASGSRLAWATSVSSDGTLTIFERSRGRTIEHRIAGLPVNAQLTAMAISNEADGTDALMAVAWRQRDSQGWWNRVAVLQQREAGRWAVQPLLAVMDTNDIRAMAFARLRLGASSDLVTVNEAGQVDVYRNEGSGGFTREPGIKTPDWRRGCQGYDLQGKDLDGDGIEEIIVAFAGEGSALTRATQCVSGGGIQVFKRDLAAR